MTKIVVIRHCGYADSSHSVSKSDGDTTYSIYTQPGIQSTVNSHITNNYYVHETMPGRFAFSIMVLGSRRQHWIEPIRTIWIEILISSELKLGSTERHKLIKYIVDG